MSNVKKDVQQKYAAEEENGGDREPAIQGKTCACKMTKHYARKAL